MLRNSITTLFQYSMRLSFSPVVVIMDAVIKIRRRRVLAIAKIFMLIVFYR